MDEHFVLEAEVYNKGEDLDEWFMIIRDLYVIVKSKNLVDLLDLVVKEVRDYSKHFIYYYFEENHKKNKQTVEQINTMTDSEIVLSIRYKKNGLI